MKILLADDDSATRRLIQSQLCTWGYQVVLAEDGERAWEELCRPDAPRLVVLDWMMPGIDGVQVCRRLRSAFREDYFYVLLLTIKSRPEDIAEGLDAGADDYVIKPFNAHELRARLKVGERVIGFSQSLLSANAMLRTLALTDELTGLLNRGAVLDRLRDEYERHLRSGLPLSALMVDIDEFKKVNDKYGHEAGDRLLASVATTIRMACRPYDVVARLGGDEIAILLPATSRKHALDAAERIRAAVEAMKVKHGKSVLAVTISVGSASSHPSASGAPEDLLRVADQGLYRAKDGGRNRVCEVEIEGGLRTPERGEGE